MESEVLRCFTERGAQSVAPDFASLLACQGLPRHAADLGDFPKAQPLALIILTHPAEAFEYVRIMPPTPNAYRPNAYRFADEPELGVSTYAVQVSGLSDFQNLRHALTVAFTHDATKVGLNNLKICGTYICPETGPASRASVEELIQMAFQLEVMDVLPPAPRQSGPTPGNR